jgi:hypothetical protein
MKTRTASLFKKKLALCLAAAPIAAVTLLSSAPASAQAVYVYAPPPPPPPPPPRYYYYSPAEPPYALVLAADFEGVVPINAPVVGDGNNLQGGGGFKLRVGEQFRLAPMLRFTPEVGYGFDHIFASDDIGNSYSWDMQRLFVGARLSFGRILTPSVYAHVGYGWRNTGDPIITDSSGVAFDVGGALDLRVLPGMTLGVHAEYATIDAQPYAPEWAAFGVHGALIF